MIAAELCSSLSHVSIWAWSTAQDGSNFPEDILASFLVKWEEVDTHRLFYIYEWNVSGRPTGAVLILSPSLTAHFTAAFTYSTESLNGHVLPPDLGWNSIPMGAESIFKEVVDVVVIQSNDRGSQRQRDVLRVRIHTDASLMWDQAGRQRTSVERVQRFAPFHREPFLQVAPHFIALSHRKH